jgi:sigma-B regulation protein RsbU (phosphoserine phosphatase)
MSLRWKLFLFLLAFSMIPLLVVSVAHRSGARALVTRIGEQIRVGISDIVARELTQTAVDYGVVLGRSKNALEFAAEVVARETAQVLAAGRSGHPVADDAPGDGLLSARDFSRPDVCPTDVAPREGYAVMGPDGKYVPLAVSRSVAAFFAAPGSPARMYGAQGMAPVASLLREVAWQFPDMSYFAGVVLENGLGLVSPGHGGFPEDFDPRRPDWFVNARQAFARGETGAHWTGPAPDPVTGRMVFTVARPVAGPDGAFAGAAFLQVLLPRVLQESEISSQWSRSLRTYLVSAMPRPETGGAGLRMWAGPEADEPLVMASPGANDQPGAAWLTSEDGPRFEAFVARMASEPSGVTVMTFQGQECFWAYSTPIEDLRFVLILPSAILVPYAEEARQEIRDASVVTMATAAGASAVVLLAAALGAFFGSKAVTYPLTEVMRAWKRVAVGDFSVRLNFRTRDERAAVAQAFNETMPKLADHMRLSESMALARQVQQNLLPNAPPDFPGLESAGINLSCDETGGDYFDYFPIRRGQGQALAVVVGDVTGHGASSALLMATGRALLRAAGQAGAGEDEAPPPWRRITDANRLLAEDVGDTGRFMTLFWIEIEGDTGRVLWVRAGHDPAYIVDPDRQRPVELLGQGPPLGVVPGHVYQEHAARIEPGQVLLLGTDGIWEARDASGEMYGKARFLQVAQAHAGQSAVAVRDAVLADLAAFKAGLSMEDDVTLVVVRRTAGG